jgi:6-phosphogluconolactonase (cycloisomerase 2 family)
MLQGCDFKEMMLIKKSKWLWLLLASLGLAGCSSSTPHHIAYVSLPSLNAIAAFRQNPHSGSLTAVIGSPFSAGASPVSIVVHPSEKFVYVANQRENDISLFRIDNETTELSEVTPRTPTDLSPVALAIGSGGTLLFAANAISNNISAYSINSGDGTLTEMAGSPFPTGARPVALVMTPSAKFLYVASANLGAVFAYANVSGAFETVAGSPFPVGSGPFSLAVDPAEHFLYVANSTANTISVLSIDDNSGILTPIAGSPFSTGISSTTMTSPISVTLHPSGKFLYAANFATDNVSGFSIDPNSGVPTLLKGAPFAAGTHPVFAVIDSAGNFLYVLNQSSTNISEFKITPDTGVLSTSTVVGTTGSAGTSLVLIK